VSFSRTPAAWRNLSRGATELRRPVAPRLERVAHPCCPATGIPARDEWWMSRSGWPGSSRRRSPRRFHAPAGGSLRSTPATRDKPLDMRAQQTGTRTAMVRQPHSDADPSGTVLRVFRTAVLPELCQAWSGLPVPRVFRTVRTQKRTSAMKQMAGLVSQPTRNSDGLTGGIHVGDVS